MIEEIGKLLTSILLITAGIMLKKDLFPNTKNTGKLWLWLIIIGCFGILIDIISFIIRN
jgi:hypothetical protein